MSKDREFLWRRLHSLLGVVPVGLFLAFHLSLNFTATGGEQAYNAATGTLELIPHSLLLLIEWVVIYIPLLFHGFYGVYIAFTATHNTNRLVRTVTVLKFNDSWRIFSIYRAAHF